MHPSSRARARARERTARARRMLDARRACSRHPAMPQLVLRSRLDQGLTPSSCAQRPFLSRPSLHIRIRLVCWGALIAGQPAAVGAPGSPADAYQMAAGRFADVSTANAAVSVFTSGIDELAQLDQAGRESELHKPLSQSKPFLHIAERTALCQVGCATLAAIVGVVRRTCPSPIHSLVQTDE